jgi:hypothetical protein
MRELNFWYECIVNNNSNCCSEERQCHHEGRCDGPSASTIEQWPFRPTAIQEWRRWSDFKEPFTPEWML